MLELLVHIFTCFKADLIHLGARFSPCMRKDANVDAAVFKDRQLENMSACCVLNDGSGCFQSDESACSVKILVHLMYHFCSDTIFIV